MSVIAGRVLQDEPEARQALRAATRSVPRLETRVVDGAEWDATVAGFDEVCQEQLHAFAISRWPDVVQEPMLFLLNGEVVGGSLMMVQRLPLGLGRIAVSKWGPMLRYASRADADAVHAGMIEALVAEYAQRRGHMLSVLPRASVTPVNAAYGRLQARGFKPGSELLFPSRYIVALRLDDAAQRKSFHQKWRYHLTKSERAGLSFEHAGPERFGEFETLYTAMTDRKQFVDHSAYDTVSTLMTLEDRLR
ncbi:MAG: family N-acetyltransferase, partial [Devosia sp.]|nr:family N-acetyltransferase [Devosia sp.]